jgi:hypothetical protein
MIAASYGILSVGRTSKLCSVLLALLFFILMGKKKNLYLFGGVVKKLKGELSASWTAIASHRKSTQLSVALDGSRKNVAPTGGGLPFTAIPPSLFDCRTVST